MITGVTHFKMVHTHNEFYQYCETEISPYPIQDGVVSLEKVVPSVQVIVLLPLSRNPSSHVTISTVPASTGNVVTVVSLFQAGSRPVHCIVSVERVI